MTAIKMKWNKGDQIRLKEGRRERLYTLVARESGAYKFSPQAGGDIRAIPDQEILDHRLDGNLVHYPIRPDGLSKEHYELLQADWDSHSQEYRLIAEIKLEYCRRIDAYREKQKIRIDDACVIVRTEVREERIDEWDRILTYIETDKRTKSESRAHLSEDLRGAKKSKKESLGRGYLKPMTAKSIETWWRLWVRVGRDRRILIPLFKKRGNRTPRLIGKGGVDLYAVMAEFLKTNYYKDTCPNLSTVYALLIGSKDMKGNFVSYNAFNDHRKRLYSSYEDEATREGKAYAAHRHDVFRRITYDMPVMEEIEIDHCLLDVMVVHEKSGRPLGRPWVSMAIDRPSRMIVGIHISFEVPSYASLQRCLMHAFWPKDLRGHGLKNRWPCEGIPKKIIVDNGKEFYSSSLHSAELALGFTLRYMPPRAPFLKGIVESCFGTMQIQVLDLNQGKTFANTKQKAEFNPLKDAKTTLPALRKQLLSWIVDDYHVSLHSGIDCTPLEKWDENSKDGVNGVSNKEDLLALLGSSRSKAIGSSGVQLYGHVYFHEELTDLRRANGPKFRFEIRSDPYDIGYVLLLDPKTHRWLKLESDRPHLSRGVSVHQNRVRRILARKLAGAGNPTTEEHLEEAAILADAEAGLIVADEGATSTHRRAARYEQDNGKFITNVAGLTGSEFVHGSPAPETVQATTLPETDRPTSDAAADVKAKPKRKRLKAPATAPADLQKFDDDFEADFAQMGVLN